MGFANLSRGIEPPPATARTRIGVPRLRADVDVTLALDPAAAERFAADMALGQSDLVPAFDAFAR